jgi:hypothetical protein
MKAYVPAIIIAGLILVIWLVPWKLGGLKSLHRRGVGLLILLYGAYLATLTGTTTQFVLPGIGAIGGGAAAGAGIGLLTYAVFGTVGVVTGGTGWAIGAGLMALFGAGLGAAGGAAGTAGFRTVSYPLVSPVFWGPLLALGVYFLLGSAKRRTQFKEQKLLPNGKREE